MHTIVIEAQISMDQLTKECASYDSARPTGVLTLGWFSVPTQLKIAGAELLVDRAGQHLEVCLIHTAANLYFSIRRAEHFGSSTFDLSETGQAELRVAVHGDGSCHFTRQDLGVSSRVNLQDALHETLRFAEFTRSLLLDVCPDLANDFLWGPWFGGDPLNGRSLHRL
jgi:hypothetical protein